MRSLAIRLSAFRLFAIVLAVAVGLAGILVPPALVAAQVVNYLQGTDFVFYWGLWWWGGWVIYFATVVSIASLAALLITASRSLFTSFRTVGKFLRTAYPKEPPED